MDIVILAGGFGTRLRPLTYTRPKPLLPVLNKPLLAHILERVPAQTRNIILPVNYLRERIEAYFADHPDPRVVLVDEPKPLGTGGAIRNCLDHIQDGCLVINGDILSNVDYDAMLQQHESTGADVTISLWRVAEPWHFGVATLADDRRIQGFVEKPERGTEPSNLINAGHYLLTRRVLDAIPTGKFFSIERELYTPWAAAGRPIYGYPFEGYWIDCGRPESVLQAQDALLRETQAPHAISETADVDASATVQSSSVGDRCIIERGARVERSILLAGARVGPRSVVRNCLLGEGVEVEASCDLDRVVVGDHGIVQQNARMRDQKLGLRAADMEATT